MKALTEKTCRREDNAMGATVIVCRQRFEIEDIDLGVKKPHLGGFNYKSLVITKSDIGKTIEEMSDHSGWRCWGFI